MNIFKAEDASGEIVQILAHAGIVFPKAAHDALVSDYLDLKNKMRLVCNAVRAATEEAKGVK